MLITVKVRQYSTGAIKHFMEVVVVFLHCIVCRSHVVKNRTKLTLDPFVIAINLLVKTEEKLTVSHHPGSCALSIWLGGVGGRVMGGRVIIGGVGCSFAELSIKWMNAFINNSGLALLIS